MADPWFSNAYGLGTKAPQLPQPPVFGVSFCKRLGCGESADPPGRSMTAEQKAAGRADEIHASNPFVPFDWTLDSLALNPAQMELGQRFHLSSLWLGGSKNGIGGTPHPCPMLLNQAKEMPFLQVVGGVGREPHNDVHQTPKTCLKGQSIWYVR